MRSVAPRMSLVPRDVLGALQALGIDADERGDEAVALCPNPEHDDTHASWSCNLDTGMHQLFFSCGFKGSFAWLVQCMQGLARGDAEQWVRERKIKDIIDGYVRPRVPASRSLPAVSETDLWKFIAPPAEALASPQAHGQACELYGVRWDADRELWITPSETPTPGSSGDGRRRTISISEIVRSIYLSPERYLVFNLFLDEVPPFLSSLHLMCLTYRLPESTVQSVVSAYQSAVSRFRLIRERADEVVLALDNDRAGWAGVGKLAFAFGTNDVRVFNYGGYRAYGRAPGHRRPRTAWTAATRATSPTMR